MSSSKVSDIKLGKYDISETTGFLMESPLEYLPEYFQSWNRLAKQMPELVAEGRMREEVLKMPLLDETKLTDDKEWRLAHLQMCIIGAGYVWQDGDKGICKSIPKCLAVPWYNISQKLGIYPILSHPSFCLANWQKIDPKESLCLDNMRSLYNVPGNEGCDWFCIVTCAIELEFAAGLQPILEVLQAVENDDMNRLTRYLHKITIILKNLKFILARMHENLTADLFYNTIRPYLAGWGGESSPLPNGLIYEGINNDQPIQVNGGSAAQSTSLQVLDAVLGVQHKEEKKEFLQKMREYMLPSHRQLIVDIESLPKNLRTLVLTSEDEELKKEYNMCVQALTDFRSYHIQIVTKYIVICANKQNRNKEFESLAQKGTGGTSLIPFLSDIRTDTKDALC